MATEQEEKASRWLPERDLLTHQLVGKLGEEASELASICCRILIQGLDGVNPDDGKPNRRALVEELSDIKALMDLLWIERGIQFDDLRVSRKYNLKSDWLDQITKENVND